MSKKRLVLPAFLEVLRDGKQVFVPVSECKDNPEFGGQIVNKALAELEDWRDKYADLFTFLEHRQAKRIIRIIDRLKREMGDAWPTLPDEVLAEDKVEEDDETT